MAFAIPVLRVQLRFVNCINKRKKKRRRSIICTQSAFTWLKDCENRSSISGDIRLNAPVFWPCRNRRSDVGLLDRFSWVHVYSGAVLVAQTAIRFLTITWISNKQWYRNWISNARWIWWYGSSWSLAFTLWNGSVPADELVLGGPIDQLIGELRYRDEWHSTVSTMSGASIPMGQGGHVPPIFMKGGHPW